MEPDEGREGGEVHMPYVIRCRSGMQGGAPADVCHWQSSKCSCSASIWRLQPTKGNEPACSAVCAGGRQEMRCGVVVINSAATAVMSHQTAAGHLAAVHPAAAAPAFQPFAAPSLLAAA